MKLENIYIEIYCIAISNFKNYNSASYESFKSHIIKSSFIHMSRIMRKPTWFPTGSGINRAAQVPTRNFRFRTNRNCNICVAKTKALISLLNVKLICTLVSAYTKCWFSHDAAHIICVVNMQVIMHSLH